MNEDNIHLLQASFAEFARDGQESAGLFFERLFALDPALRPMFNEAELDVQKTKLVASLGLIVNSLRDLSKVAPALEALAVRHVGYGVQDRHYKTVGTALIQAMVLFFGPKFSPETRQAWTEAYDLVSGIMMAAARRSQSGSAAAE